ncbi:fibronectin type III domain-containing protein [Gehongia tenuis]|uniref:Fibronectin type-III domain-containing protein n=1 Tax=Gehongia tenuis TaxID=2763655 RepID=A0A926D5Q0_9FIRM|nr:hypothetical protein [Gehongia tenuis]MBC8531922.1 hypothetical protein [Gehongia tenuis]
MTIYPQNNIGDPPYITYEVTCSCVRISSVVRYTFSLTGRFTTHSGSDINDTRAHLGTGTGTDMNFYVSYGGTTRSVQFKSTSDYWSYPGTRTGSVSIDIENISGTPLTCSIWTASGGYFKTSGIFSTTMATPTATPYYTNPSTPTVETDKKSMLIGDAVRISWTARAGTNNPILSYSGQYHIERNGFSTGWYNIGNLGNASYKDFVPSVNSAESIQYHICANGQHSSSAYGNSPSIYLVQRPAMGAVTLSPGSGYFESVRISWNAATAYSGNPVSRYEIYYQTASPGSSWSGWNSLGSVSGVTLNHTWNGGVRGNSYRFMVRAVGGASVSGNNWTDSPVTGSIQKALTPSTPNGLSSSLTTIEPDGQILLSWNAAAPNSGTLEAYEVSVDCNLGSGWKGFAVIQNTAENSLITAPCGYTAFDYTGDPPAGSQFRYRVRAKNSFGVWSSYSAYSPTITLSPYLGVYCPVNGVWTACRLYYAVDGEWVRVAPHWASENTWQAMGVTK